MLTVRGALTVDLGIGRSTRRLGPMRVRVAASPDTVFDVVASPYLARTPRAMRRKLEVLERGTDMVLASHFTPVGRHLTATTVETVRFERPSRIAFRLVRGPVPDVRETFDLHAEDGATELVYSGELGTDLWAAGRIWGAIVARSWERAVERSLAQTRAEAERLTEARRSAARRP